MNIVFGLPCIFVVVSHRVFPLFSSLCAFRIRVGALGTPPRLNPERPESNSSWRTTSRDPIPYQGCQSFPSKVLTKDTNTQLQGSDNDSLHVKKSWSHRSGTQFQLSTKSSIIPSSLLLPYLELLHSELQFVFPSGFFPPTSCLTSGKRHAVFTPHKRRPPAWCCVQPSIARSIR